MIISGAVKRIIIPLIGLVSGILLFLGSFSMSIEATIFNENYHENILKDLGLNRLIIDNIHEAAEPFEATEVMEVALGASGAVATQSSEAINLSENQMLLGNYIKDLATDDLINTNISSLIVGLLDYIKGDIDTLPYLYLNSQVNELTNHLEDKAESGPVADSGVEVEYVTESKSESKSESSKVNELFTSPVTSLSKIDKINLRLLVMFTDEESVDNILKIVSLFQYFTKYIMIVSLTLFTMILIITICQKIPLSIGWLKFTSISYTSLCLFAAYILRKLKDSGNAILGSSINLAFADITELAKNYYMFIADSLIIYLLLSVAMIFTFMLIMLYRASKYNEPLWKESLLRKKSASWAAGIVFVILSAAICFQISNAAAEFKDRDMEQAVLILKGNNDFKMVVDAKNHDFCFLRISATDSLTGEPINETLQKIYIFDSNNGSYKKAVTDDKGLSALLLEKGSYRLIIPSSEEYTDFAYYSPALYDFELAHPGRTDLNIILDRQSSNQIRIKSANLLYIP